MFIVGPNRTSTSLAFDSSPSSRPKRFIKPIFHVDPREIALGKQADDFPELPLPLTPLGPSDIFILGISNLSTLFVCQASNPLSNNTFSLRVKSLSNFFILDIMQY